MYLIISPNFFCCEVLNKNKEGNDTYKPEIEQNTSFKFNFIAYRK